MAVSLTIDLVPKGEKAMKSKIVSQMGYYEPPNESATAVMSLSTSVNVL